MNTKYLIWGVVLLLGLVTAFAIINHDSGDDKTPPSTAATPAPTAPASSSFHLPTMFSSSTPAPAPAPEPEGAPGGIVRIDDLANLSTLVDLEHAKGVPPNVDRWKQALPVAQKLIQQGCDCEEHNWLVHFIDTANMAISGSKDYDNQIDLMTQLARTDGELSQKTTSAAAH